MAHYQANVRLSTGAIVPGATVSVLLRNESEAAEDTLAVLFSDPDLTEPLDNPLVADARGVVDFYIAAGVYNILIQRFDIEDELFEEVAILEAQATGPVGPAGGDLSLTYPNPAVTRIQGIGVSDEEPTDGQVLVFNGASGQWEPSVNAPISNTPEEVVLTAGAFVSDLLLAGAFDSATRISAAWQLPDDPLGNGSIGANIKLPNGWSGERVDVIGGFVSGAVFPPFGDFVISAGVLNGDSGSDGQVFNFPFVVSEPPSEDGGGSGQYFWTLFSGYQLGTFTGSTDQDASSLGFIMARSGDHESDTSTIRLGFEMLILRLV